MSTVVKDGRVGQSLFSRVNILRATSLLHPDRISQSLAEIDALAAALKARSADKVQELTSLHVQNACTVAVKLLEEKQEKERGFESLGSGPINLTGMV
ncbi:FCD domain-containing protein [Brucellaceae bacterium D45D]